jgi:hypothetical protein
MMAQRHPSEREANYRGYKIKLERHDLCWSVRLKRDSADLPSPTRGKFHTITQSERAAMAQARRRVDESLEGWKPRKPRASKTN